MASVNWGPWAGSGMAAEAGIERMARLGFGAIEPHAGMAAIGKILAGSGSSLPPQLLGSIFFWDRCSCQMANAHLKAQDLGLTELFA